MVKPPPIPALRREAPKPPLPPLSKPKPPQPPPTPPDAAKNRPIPPPPKIEILKEIELSDADLEIVEEGTIKEFRVSEPVVKWTVDALASSLTLEEQRVVNQRLAGEFKTEYAERPHETSFGTEQIPGALLVHNGKRKIIAVGDLHGNVDRLNLILAEYGALLESGEAELLLLGDIIHPERIENLDNMSPSIKCLRAIIKLKYLYGDRINLGPGNHEVMCKGPRILDGLFAYISSGSKGSLFVFMRDSGFLEGVDDSMGVNKKGENSVMHMQAFDFLLAQYHALKTQGVEDKDIRSILQEYQRFFDAIHVSVIIKGSKGVVYLAHSAVVKGGVTQDQLIDARQNGLMDQLLYNKYENSHTIYTAQDVISTAVKLGLTDDPADTIIVSAHMPQANGNWGYQPFKDIKNHIIIHGNVYRSFGVLEIMDGQITPRTIDVAGTPAENVA